jgi:hypothetical protein
MKGDQGRRYDVAPDRRILIDAELDEAATPITLLQNRNPEEALALRVAFGPLRQLRQ